MNKYKILAASLCAALVSPAVHAIQFDGFLTVGMAKHDDDNDNTYIGSLGDRGITRDLTFETDTRFGLQMSSEVAENTSVVAQILGTGVDGNFNAVVEWAYVDIELNKNMNLRAGKVKQPIYMVNDYVEVGYAYPWIRPPVEVYYQNNPLNTINGAELLIALDMGPGTLFLQPYVGSNRDDIPNSGGTGFFEAEGIIGMDIKYAGRGYQAHAAMFHCREVNTQGSLTDVPTAFGFNVDVDLQGKGKCEVKSAGLNLDLANFVVYAEWQERTTTATLARPFGDTTAWYTTLGYRVGKWMPHITFASIEGEASTITPGAVSCAASTSGSCVTPIGAVPAGTPLFNFPQPIQTSVTAGVRYELNDSAALKIEYSMVDVETDPATIAAANNPFGANFGLFDTDFQNFNPPTDTVGIASVAIDVIF